MNKNVASGLLTILVAGGVYLAKTYLEQKDERLAVNEGVVVKDATNTFFLPSSTSGVVIHHDGYSLSYKEAYEQAEWVAYELKSKHLAKTRFNRPYFDIDKAVPTKAAHWKNYKKSGYDKGHLCPAADRKYSKAAFEETFLTSNVTPQTHSFNAGVWNKLEQKIRYWAKKHDGVYVVTGGVLKGDLPTIGFENVAVPKYFYKVILDYNNGKPKAMGFLMEHKKSSAPLHTFVVSVDKIEALTGIDFFPKLNDAVEKRIESKSNYKHW